MTREELLEEHRGDEQLSERRVRHGAVWSALSSILMRLAGICITAVVVRLVSPHDFGIFAVALTVHAVVSSIGELGASSCIARKDLSVERIAPTVATVALASCALLAIAMCLLARPLAVLLGSYEAAGPIRVLSLSVLLIGIFAVPGALLMREFRQRAVFMSSLISFVPANLILILLASHGSGAMAFAWSRVIGQLVSGLVVVAAVRRYYPPGFDWNAFLLVARFGLPLAGANILNYSLLNADYALVARQLGPAKLGTYMLAFTVASWPISAFGSMINGVTLPAISAVSQDKVRLKESVLKGTRSVALMIFPISAVITGVAQPLVLTLYGAEWRDSAPILATLALYGALFTGSVLFANFLVGVGHARLLLAVQALWIVLLLPSIYLGVVVAGAQGVAVAHVAVTGVVVIPVYLVAMRRSLFVTHKEIVGQVRRPALAALATAFVAWVTGTTAGLYSPVLGFLAGGVLATATYVALVFPLLRPQLDALGARLAEGTLPSTKRSLLSMRPGEYLRGRRSLGGSQALVPPQRDTDEPLPATEADHQYPQATGRR